MTRWIAPVLLLAAVAVAGTALGLWKLASIEEANAAALEQPEPAASVTAVTAAERPHHDSLTVIGSVLALRSVTLRNELAGTVRRVGLVPGAIVEAGTVLVALDVSVEQAELEALEAQAELARTSFERQQRLQAEHATTGIAVDQARAEHEVAVARIARTKAIIERKTIRAPFRARVGLADLHPGQYLNEGTELTTLQSVDASLHVDFAVPQDIAARLQRGDRVGILVNGDESPTAARVEAIDARVDTTTRSTVVRARVSRARGTLSPGASVRVQVATSDPRMAVAIPGSALRKGPEGDHVFVLREDGEGRIRAQLRAVEPAALLGDEVLIHDGLSAGEHVAASGSFKLRDGMPVSIARTPAVALSAAAAGGR